MVRDVRPLADQIARFDRDHARQLRRSSMSVPLNVAEGSGSRAGRRRLRYDDALGSARETLANLEAAQAVGYLRHIDSQLRNRLDHPSPKHRQGASPLIGTLVKLVY